MIIVTDKQCPLNSDYVFISKCRITTCKYYTEKTANRCIGLDNVFAATDKGITMAELTHLKMSNVPKKEIAPLCKQAHERVRAALVLDEAIQSCKNSYKQEDGFYFHVEPSVFEYEYTGADASVVKVCESQISTELGLEPWMLRFVLDVRFCAALENVKLNTLFDLTEKELGQLKAHVGIET